MQNLINEAIETAKLEYESDISWHYTNTVHKDKVSVLFGTNENGKNEVHDFCIKHKGIWVSILPTYDQLKTMFEKLNNTPYREFEEETFEEPIDDLYFHNGVNRKDFY